MLMPGQAPRPLHTMYVVRTLLHSRCRHSLQRRHQRRARHRLDRLVTWPAHWCLRPAHTDKLCLKSRFCPPKRAKSPRRGPTMVGHASLLAALVDAAAAPQPLRLCRSC